MLKQKTLKNHIAKNNAKCERRINYGKQIAEPGWD